MKNLVGMLLMGLLALGCLTKNVEEQRVEQNYGIPLVLKDAKIGEMAIPNGTTTRIERDGSGVTLTFPENFKYIGLNKAGEINLITSIKYTCTGDCTEGCDVFYVGGQFGCSQCKNEKPCTGKSSANFEDLTNAGFINTTLGIKPIQDAAQLKQLVYAPAALFDYGIFKDEIVKLNRLYYGVENPNMKNFPDGSYKNVMFNAFGNLLVYKVPSSYFERNKNAKTVLIEVEETGTKVKCACEDSPNPGGCQKESTFTYDRCVSGVCKSCSMVIN